MRGASRAGSVQYEKGAPLFILLGPIQDQINKKMPLWAKIWERLLFLKQKLFQKKFSIIEIAIELCAVERLV